MYPPEGGPGGATSLYPAVVSGRRDGARWRCGGIWRRLGGQGSHPKRERAMKDFPMIEEKIRTAFEERAALRDIFQYSPRPIAVTDEKGNFLMINEEAARWSQVDLKDGTQGWDEEFEAFELDGEPIQIEDLPLFHALEGQVRHRRNVVIVGAKGRQLMNISAAPLRRKDGTIKGAILTWDLIETQGGLNE